MKTENTKIKDFAIGDTMNTFICSQCGLTKPEETTGTGYGVDAAGNKVCYTCCGVNDSQALDTLKPKEKLLMNKLLRLLALCIMWMQMLCALIYSVMQNPIVKQFIAR